MILSFYERTQSPFVWVQYGATGMKPKQKKTPIRKDDPQKASKLALHRLTIEREISADENPEQEVVVASGWGWVTQWLRVRYRSKARTREVYGKQWVPMAQFLATHQIRSPAELERQDCFDYVDWRTSQVKPKSGKSIKLNTAIGELKLLALVMDEAVIRHLALENPARKLGIEREDPDEKPPISDAELVIIFPALRSEPMWMQRSFELALNTGLRFSDTQIRRTQMRETRIEITKPKGGRKKGFGIEIYSTIRPLIDEWLASSEPCTWQLSPRERKLTGLRWWQFFRHIGLPHLCFHCTRVTFITRGMEAGVPEGMMMKLVNHASKEIHRIYQRASPAGAAAAVAKIAIPAFRDARDQSRKE